MRLDEHARNTPDKPALIMGESGVSVSFRTLVERSRRLAHFLRSCGLKEGGTIAFMLENRPEFFDLAWTAQRLGLRYTPINWHLQPEEAAYILGDSEAKAFALSDTVARHAPGLLDLTRGIPHRLAVEGEWAGFEPFEPVLADAAATPLE